MSKVLISDYDQTFYLNDDDIEKNKIAVEVFRKKGNIFVIATGRSYLDLKNKVEKYDLQYDYAIINHGATILDKNNNVYNNFSIKNEVVKNIKRDLQLEQSIKFFCCSKLESRVEFEHENLTKINVKYNSEQQATNINKIIENKYSNFVNSYYTRNNSLEMISNEIDKSKAIEVLLKELNMNNKNVYTIGDGYSDIKMVEKFNGYAIKDSVEELKKIAQKEYNSVSDLINEIM